jgi:hypothetical protein
MPCPPNSSATRCSRLAAATGRPRGCLPGVLGVFSSKEINNAHLPLTAHDCGHAAAWTPALSR